MYLTLSQLLQNAQTFAALSSKQWQAELYGVTDGKAVGTLLEHQFRNYLQKQGFELGTANSALGLDFPLLNVDMKVTSSRQPQSSCPFRSARQKIFGLGYHLLVFVYDKNDDARKKKSQLLIQHVVFIDQAQTGDYQTTRGLLQILENQGNAEDIVAFLQDRNLPIDEIEARSIAEALLQKAPEQGYLTISNALQWRLQYARVIEQASQVQGLVRVL